jgi:hypothetical protein
MTILLPFTNDVTIELFDEAQARVVGYMFASPGKELVAQEQRWLLYPEYTSPPVQSVVFRFPEDPLAQIFTVERFLESVCGVDAPLWRPASRYVKVVAQNFESFPQAPPEPLPFPEIFYDAPLRLASGDSDGHPGRGGDKGRGHGGKKGDVQIDDHPATLGSSPNNSLPGGYVFGTQIKESVVPGVLQNYEYWVTLPEFVAASERASVFLKKDNDESHRSLSGFFDDMRRLKGAQLTVASCAYANAIPMNP